MLSFTSAQAADTYWTNPGSGDWFDPLNWDNGVPTSAVKAYIDNGGTAEIGVGQPEVDELFLSEGAITQSNGAYLNAVGIYLGRSFGGGAQGAYTLIDGTMQFYRLAVFYGRFLQKGGNVVLPRGATSDELYIAKDGSYELKGGLLDAYQARINGLFLHDAGTNDSEWRIDLGYEYGDSGTYELSGTGNLRTEWFSVGHWGEGIYRQSGGVATFHSFRVGDRYGKGSDPDGTGSAELSAGTLTTDLTLVGADGTGTFRQTGGTHQCLETFYLAKAYRTDDVQRGTYDLVDGHLQTREAYIGLGSRAVFTQTGGTHTTTFLRIHPKGHYIYSGGSLTVNGGLHVEGEFNFADQPLVLDVRQAIVNLSAGDLQGGSQATLKADANSLVIFRTGFNKANLGNYQNAGLEAWSGSPVDIPAGRTVYGWAEIPNHVQCAGRLTATANGWINLLKGVYVSGAGNVNLGDGDLTVHNLVSGMSGGQLTTHETFVGYDDVGRFVQSGGTHSTSNDLWLGYYGGCEGTYEMSAGQLSAARQVIGRYGTGHFIQTGGTNTVRDQVGGLVLAYFGGARGFYELGGSGLLLTERVIVGFQGDGEGTFIQTGGENRIGDTLTIGSNHYKTIGNYQMTGGILSANAESIGLYGQGTFTQSGGTHTVASSLSLGYGAPISWAKSSGTFNLSGGTLACADVCVGYKGFGEFTQTGGSHNVTNDLILASLSDSEGTYKLLGGTLTVGGNIVRGSGTSQFIIGGGILNILGGQTFTADALRLGDNEGDSSTFELQEGVLQMTDATIGNYGSGTFELTGGTHIVQNTTHIGVWSKSYGCYRITVGALTTSRFLVGEEGVGVLEFLGSSSQVTVTHSITFGKWGGCISIPGSKIHMTGAAFENQSTDPAAMAGLGNLELIFEGGPADLDPFEVASAVGGGFDLNFALGTLTVGGADVGCVQLVDLWDNGNRGAFGAECLFAHTVNIQTGSSLDLSGLRLYVEGDVESFLDGCVADGRLLDGTGTFLDASYRPGKDWTMVPEPATLGLLVLGAAALIRLRRRPANR